MKIYRIDGNRVNQVAIRGFSHFTTRELAISHLEKCGFSLETRTWETSGSHPIGSTAKIWYNKKLSDDGYAYDYTKYRIITEINVIEQE